MKKKEIIEGVAGLHNLIASIPVHGDDAIVMAQAILQARDLVKRLKDEKFEEDDGIQFEGG